MKITAETFAKIDQICDYIPAVSTVSNLVDLFQKCIVNCLPEKTAENRYWTHIKDKDLTRCFILLVPIIGNIYILVSDYFNKASPADATQVKQSNHDQVSAVIKEQKRLWTACLENNQDLVEKLLAKGISPNFLHSEKTPLIAACENSTVKVIQLLLDHAADINISDTLGNTPFTVACLRGDLNIMQLLYPHIQNIDVENNEGFTPLMFAASRGHQTAVAFLLEKGADSRKVTKNGTDAIRCAIYPNDNAAILPMLFGEQENIDQRKYQFKMASNFGEILPYLTLKNMTPLLYATYVGKVKSAMYLLTRSDVQASDSTNSTALHYSVKDPDLLKALLEKCKKPEFINQKDMLGSTALHVAIMLKQPEAALLLLKSGADPSIPNADQKTTLTLASEGNLVDVVAYIQQ